MSETNEKYISISDATEITKLSRVWLFNLYRQGRIPGAQKIGHDVVIPRAWAENERRRRETSVTPAQAAALLGLTVPQVQYAVRRGRLDKTVGGRVTVESVKRYAKKNIEKLSHYRHSEGL